MSTEQWSLCTAFHSCTTKEREDGSLAGRRYLLTLGWIIEINTCLNKGVSDLSATDELGAEYLRCKSNGRDILNRKKLQ